MEDIKIIKKEDKLYPKKLLNISNIGELINNDDELNEIKNNMNDIKFDIKEIEFYEIKIA